MKVSRQPQAPTAYARENQRLNLMNRTPGVFIEQIFKNRYEERNTLGLHIR